MIELRHLRYFIAVAEEQNFNRAAERVHIDQTPLARTVRDLEEQLGVALLVRAPHRIRLTPAGYELLGHARQLFVRLERVKCAVRARDARHREPLRIGVADGMAQPRMTECLNGWRAASPGVPLELREIRAQELAAALRHEEVDAAFSFGAPHEESIVQRAAWTYRIHALLPQAHVLARRRELSLAELLAFPVVACHPDHLPGLRQQMDAIRQRYAIVPVIAGEAYTLAGYLTRVAAGLGVGVADAGHLQTLRRTDVVVVPLLEDLHFVTYLLHKRHPVRSSETLRRFVDHATSLHGG